MLAPMPLELEELIARRRALGQALFDEVWQGVYHMVPAAHPFHGFVDNALTVLLDRYARAAGLVGTGPFNLGSSDDYRVPDHGYHRQLPNEVWVPSAAIVVEVVSPDDGTYAKLDFYLAHGVEEVIIADPASRSVRCYGRSEGSFAESPTSRLLGVTMAELRDGIDWPTQG